MEHVLLTGFPGFLAEHLIQRCRESRADVFWHLVVLPEQVAEASRRLRALGLTVADYAISPGDITRPDLGLPGLDAQALRAQVERCFHLAALYDLTAPPKTSEVVNVLGTRRVIEFLTACPRLRKFNYVSTCYVSGKLEGDIIEDALPTPPGFRNEYERTKYEAEVLVREAMDRLPTTIFRPAVVVGHSRTGETSKFDGPYVLMPLLRWTRHIVPRMPNLGFETTHFNAVPVDFASAVMRDVGLSDEFVGKTLQVADPAAPTTAESFQAIYHQATGRRSFRIGNRFKRAVLWLLRRFPFDVITGISAQSLDYFQHRGEYRTDNLQEACRRFDVDVPEWQDFYKPIIRFALTQQRPAPNSGVIREFKRWCLAFRYIYPIVGLAFLLAPEWVARGLTVLDGDGAAGAMLNDNLLWRPLAISLIVTLFVSVTFLERDPFQKPLHGLIIGAKVISSTLFFGCAVALAAPSLVACGVIDGIIAVIHILFYYRLKRIRTLAGSEFLWDPYHFFFPNRFVATFTDAMAPRLDDPINIELVVRDLRTDLRRFPFHVRYGFMLACYYISLLMPCLCGYRPFWMMNREQRCRFLSRVQHSQVPWLKLPTLFVKVVCSSYLFKQEQFLRSIGAN